MTMQQLLAKHALLSFVDFVCAWARLGCRVSWWLDTLGHWLAAEIYLKLVDIEPLGF